METSRKTKIGTIDFSYDSCDDVIWAYTDDGENEWDGVSNFRPSFSDFVRENEYNLSVTDHWNYASESHYTAETYTDLDEYLPYACDAFDTYIDMNLKRMELIE